MSKRVTVIVDELHAHRGEVHLGFDGTLKQDATTLVISTATAKERAA